MDRRGFFRHLGRKAGETAIEHLEQRAEQKAAHWVRPPYALGELEFLLACSRCGMCIEACPYNVIFPLPARRGGEVVNTPAMDLLNRGCHLCEDWPCVASCEPGALKRPTQDKGEAERPRLALADIDTSSCLPYLGPDCGACESACPVDGALQWSDFKPRIEQALCTGCALCREACVVEPKAVIIQPVHATE
jgi:ferredoxin-type protein NapG